MKCYTKIGPDHTVLCGHSITRHEGDESGMGGPEPCTQCGCQNFTRKPLDMVHTAEEINEALRAEQVGGNKPEGCPRCGSPQPHLHPAVQHEGEVHVCPHPWHVEQGLREAERTNPTTSKTVVKWADEAMFSAEPIDVEKGPQAHLLWMTPDPLAAIAGPAKMYKGETVRSLRDVTHAERREMVQQIMKTHLKMPFEAVSFHFVIEGVTRAFANQMVRQRTAAYAQRSDRFAVQERGIPVGLPPSLHGTTGVWRDHERDIINGLNNNDQLLEYDEGDPEVERLIAQSMVREPEAERQRWQWDKTVEHIDASYGNLVAQGMPQEDARGLFPLNTLTSLHYITNLRGLLEHGGNRLCTQAQFEWRLVFTRMVQAIRAYNPYAGLERQLENLGENMASLAVDHCGSHDRWQYETIAELFRPICYLTGKCEFKADFDRKCSIRDRVDANAAHGRSSSEWHEDKVLGVRTWQESAAKPVPWFRHGDGDIIPAIKPAEWLLNPGAAR